MAKMTNAEIGLPQEIETRNTKIPANVDGIYR
jgi:hypothetical protein